MKDRGWVSVGEAAANVIYGVAMKPLDREDMMEAVSEGMRRGIVEIASRGGRFDIPDELLYDAVRKGVADAIWRVANNATDMPCSDFYESIKQGARDGIARLNPDDTT